MKNIKYLFYLLIFFLLFYFENVHFTGSITFSQIWKIPLVLFMIIYVLNHQRIKKPYFNKIAYLFGIKNLFNQGIIIYPVTNIIETFRFINFPLLYDTVNIYFKEPLKLQKFIIRISQYFILYSIPFHLGILESFKEGMEFGEDSSFIGVFQNAHGASIISTFAVFVLIFHLKSNKMNYLQLFINLFLVIVGIYSIYMAFVRTGYLMFIIGLIIIYLPKKLKFSQIVSLALITFTIISFTYTVMQKNDSFRHRILDQSESGMQRNLGSGRLIFAAYSLEYWSEGNIHQLLFGRGLNSVKENLESKTGMKIYSHNGFVDALAINGIIGLFLLLLFLLFLYKNIRRNRKSKSYRLALAMFYSYIVYQAFQGGAGFPIDLYLVTIFNLVNKESIALNKIENK